MKFNMALLLPVLALAACQKGAPEGQVIAKVNGEEITRAELNAELRNVKAGPKADAKAIQNSVLERLVLQKVVVQAAKQDELDKSQDYILASRKSDDTILSQLFARKIASGLRTPYPNDVQAFITNNPWRFAQREILLVTQVRAPAASVQEEWLKPIDTLDQTMAVLKQHGVNFERGNAQLDTVTLDKDNYQRLTKLPPGVAFASRQGDLLVVSSIVDRRPMPLEGDTARDVALRLLQQQNGQQAFTNRVETLRKAAKVEYQSGFSAPPPPKKGS
jgi:EpsD family peptidyl-prolyl cis-trans isomerase